MPGMLTGTIIGTAQALGESAPLLMIGMVAFIVDIPGGFTDPSTVMPVQIFLWADSPERAFVEKTSGAIMVLLMFLVVMNALAVFLRLRGSDMDEAGDWLAPPLKKMLRKSLAYLDANPNLLAGIAA